jgi:hypothetical protein
MIPVFMKTPNEDLINLSLITHISEGCTPEETDVWFVGENNATTLDISYIQFVTRLRIRMAEALGRV